MKSQIQSLVLAALGRVLEGTATPVPAEVQVDNVKDPKFGDLATNVALALAKALGRKPRELATDIVAQLPASPLVTKVEIAGPGFINFFLAPGAFQQTVAQILAAGDAFGHDGSGRKGRVNVEFVSANPTGPMHVGHGRNAAFGDALANVLAASGWDVYREYYINDAGRQVEILTLSAWLRYLQRLGEEVAFPRRGYGGGYLLGTAERLQREHGDTLRRSAAAVMAGLPPEPPPAADEAEELVHDEAKAGQETYLDALLSRVRELLGADFERVRAIALDDQLARIRATLAAFGVRFDRWTSERELVDSGAAAAALGKLRGSGHVYEKDGALWMDTSRYGDEKDRVLIKADGYATYFANDLAYHVDKLERGCPNLIDVWGADHHGYMARVRAAIQALTGRKDALDVRLVQFVTLSSGKMGKRSGNFVTLQDLLDEAGTDATRFFYLMRGNEQHLEFNIELMRSQTRDNPVYYVQMVHARACSIFREAAARGLAFDAAAAAGELHRLGEEQEGGLIQVLGRYPEAVAHAAAQHAPHHLTNYLREVADAFHRNYSAHRVLIDDAALRNARLALVAATRQVVANGLRLLGVSAPEQMVAEAEAA